MLKDRVLESALWHEAVNRPADGKADAAEKHESAKRLEQDGELPVLHQKRIAQ